MRSIPERYSLKDGIWKRITSNRATAVRSRGKPSKDRYTVSHTERRARVSWYAIADLDKGNSKLILLQNNKIKDSIKEDQELFID